MINKLKDIKQNVMEEIHKNALQLKRTRKPEMSTSDLLNEYVLTSVNTHFNDRFRRPVTIYVLAKYDDDEGSIGITVGTEDVKVSFIYFLDSQYPDIVGTKIDKLFEFIDSFDHAMYELWGRKYD